MALEYCCCFPATPASPAVCPAAARPQRLRLGCPTWSPSTKRLKSVQVGLDLLVGFDKVVVRDEQLDLLEGLDVSVKSDGRGDGGRRRRAEARRASSGEAKCEWKSGLPSLAVQVYV